jgi:hypothetical protein
VEGNGSKSGRANVFATFAIVFATAPQFGSFYYSSGKPNVPRLRASILSLGTRGKWAPRHLLLSTLQELQYTAGCFA